MATDIQVLDEMPHDASDSFPVVSKVLPLIKRLGESPASMNVLINVLTEALTRLDAGLLASIPEIDNPSPALLYKMLTTFYSAAGLMDCTVALLDLTNARASALRLPVSKILAAALRDVVDSAQVPGLLGLRSTPAPTVVSFACALQSVLFMFANALIYDGADVSVWFGVDGLMLGDLFPTGIVAQTETATVGLLGATASFAVRPDSQASLSDDDGARVVSTSPIPGSTASQINPATVSILPRPRSASASRAASASRRSPAPASAVSPSPVINVTATNMGTAPASVQQPSATSPSVPAAPPNSLDPSASPSAAVSAANASDPITRSELVSMLNDFRTGIVAHIQGVSKDMTDTLDSRLRTALGREDSGFPSRVAAARVANAAALPPSQPPHPMAPGFNPPPHSGSGFSPMQHPAHPPPLMPQPQHVPYSATPYPYAHMNASQFPPMPRTGLLPMSSAGVPQVPPAISPYLAPAGPPRPPQPPLLRSSPPGRGLVHPSRGPSPAVARSGESVLHASSLDYYGHEEDEDDGVSVADYDAAHVNYPLVRSSVVSRSRAPRLETALIMLQVAFPLPGSGNFPMELSEWAHTMKNNHWFLMSPAGAIAAYKLDPMVPNAAKFHSVLQSTLDAPVSTPLADWVTLVYPNTLKRLFPFLTALGTRLHRIVNGQAQVAISFGFTGFQTHLLSFANSVVQPDRHVTDYATLFFFVQHVIALVALYQDAGFFNVAFLHDLWNSSYRLRHLATPTADTLQHSLIALGYSCSHCKTFGIFDAACPCRPTSARGGGGSGGNASALPAGRTAQQDKEYAKDLKAFMDGHVGEYKWDGKPCSPHMEFRRSVGAAKWSRYPSTQNSRGPAAAKIVSLFDACTKQSLIPTPESMYPGSI